MPIGAKHRLRQVGTGSVKIHARNHWRLSSVWVIAGAEFVTALLIQGKYRKRLVPTQCAVAIVTANTGTQGAGLYMRTRVAFLLFPQPEVCSKYPAMTQQ